MGFDRITFGTEIIRSPADISRLNDEFTYRSRWFTPVELLRQATSKGGELLAMCERFDPGKIGVIEEGALADIPLIDGNPLQNISLLTKPDANLTLIMKCARIYKNTVMHLQKKQ